MNQQALLERAFTGDQSLDGLFVVGISTTKIYCRPSCKPPTRPRLENRRYYSTSLEAVGAGFRACKLCRPDGLEPAKREAQLVTALAQNALEFENVAQMAIAARVSESKLYKLFRTHHHITPLEALNRACVQAACASLELPAKPVIEIALEVGFQSLSAFNANFKRLMQVSPVEYRRSRLM
jgi:methylphosphotriester-DNA--protein-cysteine methyltransferase